MDTFATGSLSVILVLILAITTAVSGTAWNRFEKIPFTPESKTSQSYDTVKNLLIAQTIVGAIIILVPISIAIWRTGSKKPLHYGFPLGAIFVALISVTIMNIFVYFNFRNLTVTDTSSSDYKFVSDFAFLAPFAYGLVTLLLVIVWMYIRRKVSPETKAIKVSREIKQEKKRIEEKKEKLEKAEEKLEKRKTKLKKQTKTPLKRGKLVKLPKL